MKKQFFWIFWVCVFLGAFLFTGIPGLAEKAETMNEFFGVSAVIGAKDNPDDMAAFAGWIRDYTHWGWFEPQNNVFTFTNAVDNQDFDAGYTRLKEVGVKNLMCISGSPVFGQFGL